jgi:ketosteroid isomerase-like protein
MDTTAVVEAYFRSANGGDWEGWADLFADDAILEEPIGTVKGAAAIRAGTKVLTEGYRTFQNKLLSVIVDGEEAVAITHISAVTRGGAAVEVDAANVYRISGGKILHQRNYFDPAGLRPFLDELKQGA